MESKYLVLGERFVAGNYSSTVRRRLDHSKDFRITTGEVTSLILRQTGAVARYINTTSGESTAVLVYAGEKKTEMSFSRSRSTQESVENSEKAITEVRKSVSELLKKVKLWLH